VTTATHSANSDGPAVSLENDVDHHLHKDMLRFTTAGSVDDGKSTLIGRLLHDSKAVYEDQLASVRNSRFNRSGGPIDFALLTDGLRAEREQGITIDVAYRYFETPVRKFIIADTPGHEQYTRNMATGASTADLAVILVDATRGLQAQTRRHAYIASLLGISNVVAAINKMDLVGYSEEVFYKLQEEFLAVSSHLGIERVVTIPISALAGDNVVNRAGFMPWYEGPTLLRHLETVSVHADSRHQAVRFPVQWVIRPDATFRGFAGQLASGTIRPGDELVALPSGQKTSVRSIVGYHGERSEAFAPMSTTLTLENEIDLSRGDMLVSPNTLPCISNQIEAMVVWLDAKPLTLRQNYLIKHNVRSSRLKTTKIRFRVNMQTLEREPALELHMNDIAAVEFEAASPLFFDPYRQNRVTGSFILIDPLSNATVGAAMIQGDAATRPQGSIELAFGADVPAQKSVAAEDRYERHGHVPAVIFADARPELATYLERALFSQGFEVLHVSGPELMAHDPQTLLSLASSVGLIVILSASSNHYEDKSRWKKVAADRSFRFVFDLAERNLPADDQESLAAVLSLLAPLRLQPKQDPID
jgi:bifunctional enzyme CysN/CysC/sulfate adenylyltransferase subunit 1